MSAADGAFLLLLDGQQGNSPETFFLTDTSGNILTDTMDNGLTFQ